MRVDLGNALDRVASSGVSRKSLDRLDERIADAHKRIERGRADDEFGYTALNLPERTDSARIHSAVADLGPTDEWEPKAVLTVGIGGSALGAATITETLSAEIDHRILDNVDPAHVRTTLDELPLSETAISVVSKSGTTAETLSNFLVVRAAFERAGVDWTDRTIVTTGEEGPLRRLADREGLPSLPVPDGVPGRFSALSSMGLVPAAAAGIDLDELLAGGQDGADTLSGSLFETPAYAYGATAYALSLRGASVNAMMPYAEGLERFAEWFAQLWAESLGKDGVGQVPVRALGATDQHSQLQLYRAGPRNLLVTMVRPTERPPLEIPDAEADELAYLGGHDLGELLDVEFDATEASLAAAGRPTIRIEIDRLDERSLGELLYGMEAACVLAGELYEIETFTQPAVEWGKNAARGLLGAEATPEADAVGEKEQLWVE